MEFPREDGRRRPFQEVCAVLTMFAPYNKVFGRDVNFDGSSIIRRLNCGHENNRLEFHCYFIATLWWLRTWQGNSGGGLRISPGDHGRSISLTSPGKKVISSLPVFPHKHFR
jgi:hypothetical protein